MSRPPTNLATSASAAAFGAARALTSYVRDAYERKYHGHRPFPKTAFFVDGALLVIVSLLVGATLWFAAQPTPKPLVNMSLVSAPLMAGAPVPLAVTLRANGTEPLRNVRLRWRFPAGTQLLQSQPVLTTDGSVFLGDLAPGEESVSHVIARAFQAAGETATFTLEVSYHLDNGVRFQFTGSAARMIATSALTADLPSVIRNAIYISSEGTTIPIEVANHTSATLPFAHFTYRVNGMGGEERRALGDLLPGEHRFIFIPVTPNERKAEISWTAGAASRDLVSGSWRATVTDGAFPSIEGPLLTKAGVPSRFGVSFEGMGGGVVIVHPAFPNPVSEQAVSSGRSQITLPALAEDHPSNHEWLLIPVIQNKSGGVDVLGPASLGATASDLPFTAQVRYLSTAGDQLGAGPRPPQAGLETRYWAFWTIGPVESELKDIIVETDLPAGVEATGNVSSPEGGSVVVTGRRVRFTLPRMGGDTDVPEVSAGFEIGITPVNENVGSLITLLATSTARAADTHATAMTFGAEDGPKTTWLPEDKENQAKGIVVPGE